MAETRVTGGDWRGRKIETPAGHNTRPTASKVREALFNILGGQIEGARVLDLYAGAGTFSFEALSRGAEHATLVERDRKVVSIIKATAGRLACGDRLTIVADSVEHWLTRTADEQFDLVWIDPPYSDDGIVGVLESAARLSPSLLVCEHRKSRQLPDVIGAMLKNRTATYGQTSLSFFAAGEGGHRG